jgi:hypothetical protein
MRAVLACVFACLLGLALAVGPLHSQSVTFAVNPSQPATCIGGEMTYVTGGTAGLYYCSAPNTWTLVASPGGGAGVPSGAIVFVASGTCPSGYTEVAGLDGKMLRGTVAAHGDVGGTGGSDSVTPTFTGSAWSAPAVSWPAGVPTAANESAHTHSVTAAGTNGTGTVTPSGSISIGSFVNVATATSGNCAATNIAAGTGSTTACKATAPNLTVPAEGHSGTLTFTGSSSTTSAETFTGSAVTSGAGSAHTHTLSWPAGVPTLASYTPAGTVSAVDTRAAYTKLIGCSKN